MTPRRTIAVVTGTRADFGLLAPIMRAVADHPRLTLRVIATGVHLTTGSWRDIPAAGFHIDTRTPMQRRDSTGRAADVAALARGIAALGKTFNRLQPDIVLVLGDRIEAFAAAAAASVGGHHLAHVHGGDRAQGVADEAIRHAISKLAHLHFPATAQSRRRLIRMGEPANHIHNLGSPAIDGLAAIQPAPDAPDLIIIQHPIGAPDADEARWMRATLAATRQAARSRLILAPNADPGSAGIRTALRNVEVVQHLPRPRFLALLKAANAIVGNSSAGLIEAAALRIPCVNVGPRQAGRESPANVIHCDYGSANVQTALNRALSLNLTRLRHPYGAGHTGERIAATLANLNLRTLPLSKRNTY